MPASGPRPRGARNPPRPSQGIQPWPRTSAAPGLGLATQKLDGITGRGTRLPAVAGQYVAYTFFKVDPAWRRLPIDERRAGKDAFAEAVEDWAGRMASLRAYSLTGVRPDADFFLWKITE